MSDLWYRGESTNLPPSAPGGDEHDFGDGLYFTDSRDVAALYAETRVLNGGGQPRVLELNAKPEMLGRVLDLQGPQWNPAWKKYLDTPVLPNGPTREQMIRRQNTAYNSFFSEFTKQNRINLSDYDAVIGPEMVRGGRQLCLLHRNGRFSTVAEHLRRQLREVPRMVTPEIDNIPVVSGQELMMPKSNMRRVLGNQGVATGIALAVAAVVQSLNEKAINHAFTRDVEGRLAKPIQMWLERGSGILLIIMINQRADFMTGMTYRLYQKTDFEPGPTRAAALKKWRAPPYIREAPLPNNILVEEYAWISPLK